MKSMSDPKTNSSMSIQPVVPAVTIFTKIKSIFKKVIVFFKKFWPIIAGIGAVVLGIFIASRRTPPSSSPINSGVNTQINNVPTELQSHVQQAVQTIMTRPDSQAQQQINQIQTIVDQHNARTEQIQTQTDQQIIDQNLSTEAKQQIQTVVANTVADSMNKISVIAQVTPLPPASQQEAIDQATARVLARIQQTQQH
jgi:preprotein translocase subunit SecF